MTCHLGGFLTVRHNDIRDFTASLLTEVCHNVGTEPTLQPLKLFLTLHPAQMLGPGQTLKQEDFGQKAKMHILRIRVIHPIMHLDTFQNLFLLSFVPMSKPRKGNMHGHRIRDVEHGVLTALVFSTSGAMGREAPPLFANG